VVQRIVGPSGSVVRLKIRHLDGAEAMLTMTRGPITLESVLGYRRDAKDNWEFVLDPEHRVGYVEVAQFGGATPDDLKKAIEGLKGRGMSGLILDLRFCPGGMLDSALQCAKLFVENGTIVSVRGRDQAESTFRADGKTWLGSFPLVVLVNG